ncbi:MAG: hypothetical protein LBM28_07300 [Oscillospiraceae bacterium]|jgi:bifunctional UDP-N-acetylglucosamine pyrophosphorylase/glucosamine-1-phosphate N-acetyltransferase|nr:hypothetical protein [Oscillospiraceae bacterium]
MKKGVSGMLGSSAVIFVPDDTAKTGLAQPLLLVPALGAPLLRWLANSLCAEGVGRFFLVCHDRYIAQARACFPAEAEVVTGIEHDPSDLLHVFLSTAEDSEAEVTVVTGAAMYLPQLASYANAPRPSCVRRVSREAMMAALDERFSFVQVLRENGAVLSDCDGFYSVETAAAAAEAATLLRRNQALALLKAGVEIFDWNSCYISPSARIKPGAKLLPGASIRGDSVIAEGAVIGPWSVIDTCTIGADTRVNASQVSRCAVGKNVQIGPYCAIGAADSDAPQGSIGDDAVISPNTTLSAPICVENGAKITPEDLLLAQQNAKLNRAQKKK